MKYKTEKQKQYMKLKYDYLKRLIILQYKLIDKIDEKKTMRKGERD